MPRCCPALIAAAAIAMVLAGRPSPCVASGLFPTDATTYRLTNTGPEPVDKVVTTIVPPGAVEPPSDNESPLKVLPGSTGFEEADLKVLLGEGKEPETGDPLQALALDFGSPGLAGDGEGVLNFALSIDQGFQGTPELILPATSEGLMLVEIQPMTTPDGGNGGTVENPPIVVVIPEPMPLAIWSALVGLALARGAWTRRRTSPTALA